MSEHDRILDEAADAIFVAAHMLKAMADSYQLTLLKEHRASNLVDWRGAECDALDDLADRLFAVYHRESDVILPSDGEEIGRVSAHLYMVAACLREDGAWKGQGNALDLLADRLSIYAADMRRISETLESA